MVKSGGTATPPSPTPERPRLKLFFGVAFLTALMLFLFWPVVKFLVSLVAG